MRKLIVEKVNAALEHTGRSESYDELADDVVLLETGLDSLGFAVLVTMLEEELGFDPFQTTAAVYPRTFGEFVHLYADHLR